MHRFEGVNLTPRYYRTSTILNSSPFNLDIPTSVDVHFIFHVKNLKELLGFHINIIIIKYLEVHKNISFKFVQSIH